MWGLLSSTFSFMPLVYILVPSFFVWVRRSCGAHLRGVRARLYGFIDYIFTEAFVYVIASGPL